MYRHSSLLPLVPLLVVKGAPLLQVLQLEALQVVELLDPRHAGQLVVSVLLHNHTGRNEFS